jgi:hypothetical protein
MQLGKVQGTPVTIAAAGVVVLLIVATGVAALAHLGPFSSPHKTLAITSPSATGSQLVADPTAGPSKKSGGTSRGNSRRSGSSRGSKRSQTGRKALPTVTASGSGSGKSSSSPPSGGGGQTTYGPNLLTDGSFADSTLGAWNYAVEGAAVAPGFGPGGGNAVRLTASPQAGIMQEINGLTPGASYLVTGWGQTVESNIFIGAADNDSAFTKKVAYTFSSTSWSKGSVVFTLGQGQTSAVVFCVQGSGGSGYCANMRFQAIHHS